MKPPEGLLKDAQTVLNALRSEKEDQVSLVNEAARQLILCGRIWNQELRKSLQGCEQLTSSSGKLNALLRTFLAFHDLETMNASNWEEIKSIKRLEYLGDLSTNQRSEALEQLGLTEDEGYTLDYLSIERDSYSKEDFNSNFKEANESIEKSIKIKEKLYST